MHDGTGSSRAMKSYIFRVQMRIGACEPKWHCPQQHTNCVQPKRLKWTRRASVFHIIMVAIGKHISRNKCEDSLKMIHIYVHDK